MNYSNVGRLGMIQLKKSLGAWNTPGFKVVLKDELEHLRVMELPLQKALTHSSYAVDSKFSVMIISY